LPPSAAGEAEPSVCGRAAQCGPRAAALPGLAAPRPVHAAASLVGEAPVSASIPWMSSLRTRSAVMANAKGRQSRRRADPGLYPRPTRVRDQIVRGDNYRALPTVASIVQSNPVAIFRRACRIKTLVWQSGRGSGRDCAIRRTALCHMTHSQGKSMIISPHTTALPTTRIVAGAA